jgi:hypothetical protein
MIFNGSGFNASSLNESAGKLPAETVLFDGSAPIVVDADLVAQRTTKGGGDLVLSLLSSEAVSAASILSTQAQLDGAILKLGTGTAALELSASLFYTRTREGSGDAVIEVLAFNDSAGIYLTGDVEFDELATPELDGYRVQHGDVGVLLTIIEAEGEGSITRRSTSGMIAGLEVDTLLDPASVIDGVKSITGSGSAVVSLVAEDDGMLGRSRVGDLTFGLAASGTGTIRKQGTGQSAISALIASGDFRATSFGSGNVAMTTAATLDGSVVVRGEGSGVLLTHAAGSGSVTRRGAQLQAIIPASAYLSGNRVRPGAGSITATLTLPAMTGYVITRAPSMHATILPAQVELDGLRLIAEIVLGSGTAILECRAGHNPYAFQTTEDTGTHLFYRSGLQREFIRPAFQREFLRVQ